MTKFIRHLIEYILLCLFFTILRSLSFKNAGNLSAFVVRKLGPLTKFHNRILNNLTTAFPKLSLTDKIILSDKIWNNLGKTIGEFPHSMAIKKEDLAKYTKITGMKNLNHLKEGGFIFGAHFSNWEIIPNIFFDFKNRINIVYRKSNNPFIDNYIQNIRNKQNVKFIPKGHKGAKKIIQALQKNEIIVMLMDQRMHEGIEVPFFNHKAYTATAIAAMALQYNKPIIPIYSLREESLTSPPKINIFIEKPIIYNITGKKESDIYNILRCINKKIESWIKKDPSHWFWIHNRWQGKK